MLPIGFPSLSVGFWDWWVLDPGADFLRGYPVGEKAEVLDAAGEFRGRSLGNS